MPTKGTTLKTGSRLAIVNPKFYRQFIKETKIDIDYKKFSEIIQLCNEVSALKVLENTSGYKIPENMGYLAVNRYKSKKRSIDYKKTKEFGTIIYHTNFHSYGYKSRVQWFSSQIVHCKFHQIYKFIPERKMSRELGKRMKSGKVYNEFNYSHFKLKKIRLNLEKKFN